MQFEPGVWSDNAERLGGELTYSPAVQEALAYRRRAPSAGSRGSDAGDARGPFPVSACRDRQRREMKRGLEVTAVLVLLEVLQIVRPRLRVRKRLPKPTVLLKLN